MSFFFSMTVVCCNTLMSTYMICEMTVFLLSAHLWGPGGCQTGSAQVIKARRCTLYFSDSVVQQQQLVSGLSFWKWGRDPRLRWP